MMSCYRNNNVSCNKNQLKSKKKHQSNLIIMIDSSKINKKRKRYLSLIIHLTRTEKWIGWNCGNNIKNWKKCFNCSNKFWYVNYSSRWHHHHHHHHVMPHGYPWPSLATSPHRSLPLAGLQGYIPYPHRAAVCMFELVILLLLGHMWGP